MRSMSVRRRGELSQVTKILIILPGWSIEEWMDDYTGTIEYRAVRETLTLRR